MSNLENLRESVIEQAHEKGSMKLLDSKKKINDEFEMQKSVIVKKKEAEHERKLKELQQKYQIIFQQLKNKERQSTLVSKQKILKELFQSALIEMESWSADKEMEFIYRILERYSQQEVIVTFGERTLAKFNLEQLEKLKFSFPNHLFSEQPISNESGLLISIGKIDDNYLYKTLIGSISKEESSSIANQIFIN
ncbi:V-type H+-ATPase, subunit E [Streptococcus pneumoniae]|nr:V-type H+-ATPase, subunit E [Streptococcus pneumoniae]